MRTGLQIRDLVIDVRDFRGDLTRRPGESGEQRVAVFEDGDEPVALGCELPFQCFG